MIWLLIALMVIVGLMVGFIYVFLGIHKIMMEEK